jgi:hypothetical protein
MKSVKVIPLSRAYKANWDRIFAKGKAVKKDAVIERKENEDLRT